MTDMEKKVMIRLCAKIVADTDLYERNRQGSAKSDRLGMPFGADKGKQ